MFVPSLAAVEAQIAIVRPHNNYLNVSPVRFLFAAVRSFAVSAAVAVNRANSKPDLRLACRQIRDRLGWRRQCQLTETVAPNF